MRPAVKFSRGMAFLLAAQLLWPAGTRAETDLRALIRQVEKQYWSSSSHGLMAMEVATSRWQRTMVMEAWSRGDNEFLVRIREPVKDRGVATLKSGNDIWNYLPKVDRTIKVPSSLMGESWMGSHLTNDDLVKESRVEDDYTFRLLEERQAGGETLLVIEALPRPDAPVVWGKLVYTINKKTLLPLVTIYYDEEGQAAREMRFGEMKSFGGRLLPSKVTVLPLDKPGERTVITYRELTFDLPLAADFFSLKNLK